MDGWATAVMCTVRRTQVIGCQPLNSKVMYESVKVGQIVFEESADTLSDGTAGGVEDDAVRSFVTPYT